jgi:hypothetical protein
MEVGREAEALVTVAVGETVRATVVVVTVVVAKEAVVMVASKRGRCPRFCQRGR